MPASIRLNAAAGAAVAAVATLVLAVAAPLGSHAAGHAAPYRLTAETGPPAVPTPTTTLTPDNHGWGG